MIKFAPESAQPLKDIGADRQGYPAEHQAPEESLVMAQVKCAWLEARHDIRLLDYFVRRYCLRSIWRGANQRRCAGAAVQWNWCCAWARWR